MDKKAINHASNENWRQAEIEGLKLHFNARIQILFFRVPRKTSWERRSARTLAPTHTSLFIL